MELRVAGVISLDGGVVGPTAPAAACAADFLEAGPRGLVSTPVQPRAAGQPDWLVDARYRPVLPAVPWDMVFGMSSLRD